MISQEPEQRPTPRRYRLLSWWRRKWGLIKVRAHIKRRCELDRKLELEREYRLVRDRRAAWTAALGAGMLLGITSANADTAFSAFAFTGTASPTSRTMPARIADIINAKEWGCAGNGIADDTAAIRVALAKLTSGQWLWFPAGSYITSSEIDISGVTGQITGSGVGATAILGSVTNGFIFSCPSGAGTVQELSHMTIHNGSTVKGTGAVRWMNNQSCSSIIGVNFSGMIGLDSIWNSFNLTAIGCNFGSSSTLASGSIGCLSDGIVLMNCRFHDLEVAVILSGTDGSSVLNCGAEENGIFVATGYFQGWGRSCTVAPDGSNPGFSILTVAGDISPTIDGGSNQPSFSIGDYLIGNGLTNQTWCAPETGVQITADHSTDGTLTGTGGTGTYRISGTFTIASAVPMCTRRAHVCGDTVISGIETEGNYIDFYLRQFQSGTISGCQLTGAVTEAAGPGAEKSLTAKHRIYIGVVGQSVFSGIVASQGCFDAAIKFEAAGGWNTLVLQAVLAQATANTSFTGYISGTTLTVTATIGGAAVIFGGTLSGSGATGTVVNQLTGSYAGVGTYTVSASQTVGSSGSPVTLTTAGGAAWNMGDASSSIAGATFIGCNNSLPQITFAYLPGGASASANVPLKEGDEFTIVDGQKSGGGTATWNDVVAGGSSGHYKVRYDGTNWRRIG